MKKVLLLVTIFVFALVGCSSNGDVSEQKSHSESDVEMSESEVSEESEIDEETSSENSNDESDESSEQSSDLDTSGDDAILNVENSEDLAELLLVNDPLDPSVSEFAEKYKGQIIQFNANIAHVMNHGDYDTRFDFLIYAGDYSESSVAGPSFKFEDVNYLDLNFVGENAPDSAEVGLNIIVTAEVVEYNEMQGLLFLDPISTELR